MLEAETAIARLPTNEREAYREIVADRIHTLTKWQPETHTPHTPWIQTVKLNQIQTTEI